MSLKIINSDDEYIKEPVKARTLNKLNSNIKGGTELMRDRLLNSVDPKYWDKINLIISKIDHDLIDSDRKNIFWIHDTAIDPAVSNLNDKALVDKIDLFVFVSHWQMYDFMQKFSNTIDYTKCAVIYNAIEPISMDGIEKPKDKLKFIYTSTPHRGLDILYSAICSLTDTFKRNDFEVDIYSSFKIYGWNDLQEKYKGFFDNIAKHPNINYYGTVSNQEVREALKTSHIFVYPSTYKETYCLSMVEAMSAKNICMFPNLGALPEVSANFGIQYVFVPDKGIHAGRVASLMNYHLDNYYNNDKRNAILESQKSYFDTFHSWDNRVNEWNHILSYFSK